MERKAFKYKMFEGGFIVSYENKNLFKICARTGADCA